MMTSIRATARSGTITRQGAIRRRKTGSGDSMLLGKTKKGLTQKANAAPRQQAKPEKMLMKRLLRTLKQGVQDYTGRAKKLIQTNKKTSVAEKVARNKKVMAEAQLRVIEHSLHRTLLALKDRILRASKKK